MKIEIWSDVMCPYCYIGKRRFEKSLEQFPHKADIAVEWKSYQIAPDLKPVPGQNLEEMIASGKGMSIEEVRVMNNQATQVANYSGLTYNFDKTIPANTFNAHRFIHFAKQHGKQTEAEEILFASYFTNGRNIDDYPTLIELGKKIGLDAGELKTALENGNYAEDVRADIREGRNAGLEVVPFYRINGKQILAGVQSPRTMLKTIEEAYEEWKNEHTE